MILPYPEIPTCFDAPVADLLEGQNHRDDAHRILRACSGALAPFLTTWAQELGIGSSLEFDQGRILLRLSDCMDPLSLWGTIDIAVTGGEGITAVGRMLILRLLTSAFTHDPQLWYLQGSVLYECGMHESAEQALLRAEHLDRTGTFRNVILPLEGEADRHELLPALLAASVLRQGRAGDAVRILESLAQRHRLLHAGVENSLGVCHVLLGQAERARPHFEVALRTPEELRDAPQDVLKLFRGHLAVAHLNLAWCQLGLGDGIEAAAEFGKALRLIDTCADASLHRQVLDWYGEKGMPPAAALTWSLRCDYGMLMLHPSEAGQGST